MQGLAFTISKTFPNIAVPSLSVRLVCCIRVGKQASWKLQRIQVCLEFCSSARNIRCQLPLMRVYACVQNGWTGCPHFCICMTSAKIPSCGRPVSPRRVAQGGILHGVQQDDLGLEVRLQLRRLWGRVLEVHVCLSPQLHRKRPVHAGQPRTKIAHLRACN